MSHPTDTELVILERLFSANLLASTKKLHPTQQKQIRISNKIYYNTKWTHKSKGRFVPPPPHRSQLWRCYREFSLSC